ncbi:MAG: glycosyltransferase family 39 protein [Nitrospirae bacterium YQR-1]
MIMAATCTICAFLSFYLFFTGRERAAISEKILYSGVLLASQIIFSELALGLLNILYPTTLCFLNMLISAVVLYFKGPDLMVNLKTEIISLRLFLKGLFYAENISLFFLFFIASVWILLSVYFLPPRGVDDLSYHLPPVFEFVQKHRVFLPAVQLNPFVAYPMSAELLFLWPVIFMKNQVFVDSVQFIVALYGIVVTYALARNLNLGIRNSIFSALLCFFVPVTMAQTGCNYIDIITSVFFLTALVILIKYNLHQKAYLAFALGASVGLITSMKYHMIIPALGLQVMIMQKMKKKHLLIYIAPVFALTAYWYIRNLIVFHNPFYPLEILKGGIGIYATELSSKIGIFEQLKAKVYFLLISDIGLGTFHGGYGIAFWGLAFPSWLYCLYKSFLKKEHHLFIYLQVFLGMIIVLIVPYDSFNVAPRYAVFITAICFISLGKVLEVMAENKYYRNILKTMAVLSSVLSLFLFSMVKFPTYNIIKPINDLRNNTTTTEAKYYALGYWDLPVMSPAFEALDYLTIGDGRGLSVYVAMAPDVFWVSPVYGTQLQNTIWNLNSVTNRPDAFFYFFGKNGEIVYIREKVPFYDIALNPQYQLIHQSLRGVLFIKGNFFDSADKRKKLMSFYEKSCKNSLDEAAKIKSSFQEDIPIVVIPHFGYGLKYYELNGNLNNRVHLVSHGFEDAYVKNFKWDKVYTFINKLSGYRADKILEIPADDGIVSVYLNEKEPITNKKVN